MATSRPLSPHLGIYRWRVNMLQSTLHRLTGLFLSAGVLLVAWALIAAAAGNHAWQIFTGVWLSVPGQVLLFLWTWSLLFHLVNGIHHLVRDMGLNYGPPRRDRTHNPVYWSTGWLVIVASVVLTVIVWVLLALHVGGGVA
ncbi:MAG TPA: succinate dehydrogenase, cytochrome b556 subunit [Rhodanobacteraceae bacterium]|nr:succinate dehydrogenase, cytochrome b556 subunit [Rhodanobacteraceae bacterium]